MEQKDNTSVFEQTEASRGEEAHHIKKKKHFWQYSMSLNIGLVIIVIVLIFAFFPQFIAPYEPNTSNPDAIMLAPSAEHLFGTDNYGRDIFSRVVWGTRIDVAMGIFAMIVPLIVGSIIGLIAGYYGGWIDTILMRILDVVMAFPFILMVIVIVAILGSGLMNMFIAIWLVAWRDYARLVRSEVMIAKHSEYVMAAKVLGYSEIRIILGHILPNVVNSAITFAAADIVMCMLTGASMSFLGLGVEPPTPEWGALISTGRPFMTQAWWMCTLPGVAICIAGVGFSLFGDGISDVLRAKSR
ncbi:ABC transporter permease [Lawsonibacter celer]|jgi:peptide/nickel transport system permease protein|uniref:ABC transporter permease n=1 Tax=Lawsonibacter celer TaxID=2986526 RepID=UPI001FADA54D|nr:ABC transporter permease [Lawsonibacter celer]